ERILEPFLPKNGRVLITSTNSDANDWGNDTLFKELRGFSDKEEVGELQAMAKSKPFELTDLSQEDAAYLLKELGGYPLALAQFFSLCHADKKRNMKNPVANRIADLRKCRLNKQDKKVLAWLGHGANYDVRYNKSAYIVLKMSLEALEKEEKGKEALQLLRHLAYVDPQKIPLDWVSTWKDSNGKIPEDVTVYTRLSLLKKYSLIQEDADGKHFYAHSVTQRIVRSSFPRAEDARYFKKLIDSLAKYAGDPRESHEHPERWATLLLHGSKLYDYLAPLRKEEQPGKGKTGFKVHSTTLKPNSLRLGYSLAWDLRKACEEECLYKEAEEWSNKLIEIASKLPKQPSEHYKGRLAESYRIRGRVYYLQGRHKKALDDTEKAHKIFQ
ncbi:MAG: tetratricopeptide repeat protein, partial [Bacteroidota bacterium]